MLRPSCPPLARSSLPPLGGSLRPQCVSACACHVQVPKCYFLKALLPILFQFPPKLDMSSLCLELAQPFACPAPPLSMFYCAPLLDSAHTSWHTLHARPRPSTGNVEIYWRTYVDHKLTIRVSHGTVRIYAGHRDSQLTLGNGEAWRASWKRR